jgi:hypothetical protein
MGRSRIRAILESARGILPKDDGEAAKFGRAIASFTELQGLIMAIKIGVVKDETGQYSDKNNVKSIITPDSPEYLKVMGYESV